MKKYKSPSYGYKLSHENGYPGSGQYYAVCDRCGRKMRVKDMKVTHGTLGKLLVCPADYEEPHPQDYLTSRPERKAPTLTRPEASDSYQFVDTAAEIETGASGYPSGRSPDAPANLTATASSSSTIILQWNMIDRDPGSGSIIGYKIERESPVGGGFSTLVSNTGYPSTYYENTGLSASTQYNYRVSAINDYGTSSASDAANATTTA